MADLAYRAALVHCLESCLDTHRDTAHSITHAPKVHIDTNTRTIRYEIQGAIREGVGEIGALKILALPKRGGGSEPCQDFLVDLTYCTEANLKG